MDATLQAKTLASFGASPSEIEELLAYNENVFDLSAVGPETRFPLPDEPHVAFWERLARQAAERGAWNVLVENLPQLRFPIRQGMSEAPDYQAATRRGADPERLAEATGLEIERPELVELVLHQSPAGRIPLLVARGRAEFVALLRALARRNEPAEVPDSQGALMVSGYNNWGRVAELRRAWEEVPADERVTATWNEEFARLKPQKELYQDRFILLSDGPYSAVPASALGLAEDRWRELSLLIRRDHECSHYLTKRLFGSMKNNALDELIADYAGLTGALGRYRADWFLRFMGLEDFPRYRQGARLDIYRGDPPLTDGAFRVLQALLKAAADNLERFDRGLKGPRILEQQALTLAAICLLRLEELAAPGGAERLERQSLSRVQARPPRPRSTAW